tara:strand:- start:82 stop:762 length:681 start_codon:yes stop_codon:yes gene_type:complete
MTKKIILTLLIILLPIIIITASTDSVIFNKQNYLKYENRVEKIINLDNDANLEYVLENSTEEGKEEVIINLLDYFNNNKEIIEQEEFTQEEKLHFLDVKNTIRAISSILLLSIMMTAMLLIYLFEETKKKRLRNLSFYIINGSSITIVIVISIYLLSQNFNYFFTLFHSLLFKAGTWIFPAESLSIRLFPLELFQEITKKILIKISSISLILISIGIIYKKLVLKT